MRERIRRLLASRWIIAVAAGLAFALALPSLNNGLEIDDHLYRARVVGDHWSFGDTMSDLFTFADARKPELTKQQMDSGELSWWAAPHLHWRYFRPVAHAQLYAELGGSETWMHLHSILWLAGLAAVVAALYRRMFGATWVAGLAAVIYAVDDGHGFTAGWVANRCGLMAALFGAAALLAHARGRRIVAPLLLLVGLLSSEEGIAACGLLGAYALVMEDGPLLRRLRTMLPYVGVVLAWYVAWHALGYGIDGTGSYTDPVANPGRWIVSAAQRAPILAHSALGALPADLWEVYFVRHDLTWVMVLAGVVYVAIIAFAMRRLIADRVARFWAVGFLLSLPLVCGAHPTDRHLLLVTIAGAALVARYLADPNKSRVLAVWLVLVHLVLAPIELPIRARMPGSLHRGLDHIDALVPTDIASQDLVLVNVPFKYLCNFASVVRRSNLGVSPRHWYCLGVSAAQVEVARPDARTLVLRPAEGYLRYFEDTNVRTRDIPFHAGDKVELSDVTIEVTRITADDRPAEVTYRFAVPLEDPVLRMLVWQRGDYRPFVAPPVGGSTVIPADPFAFGDLL